MNHMDSDLYLALVNDNIDVLKGKDWLKDGDQLTPANNTMLHLACQHGSIRCVNEILSAYDESLLLRINSRGETALHLAARQGHYDTVGALINKANSSDPQPNNLENKSTVLQNLIRAPNMEFETALHAAVRYNKENVVKLLVKEDPSFSYPPNKYDETPLYLAAVRCYNDVTAVILINCDSITYGGPNGRTALHAALMSYDGYECMNSLLEKNKDLVKVADNNGWTAFHYVAHNKLYRCVEILMNIDKSVAYLADKKYKRTPLHVAAYKGHCGMVKELLDYLPDAWESVDGNGQNILHIALTQKDNSLISFILSKDMKSSLFIQRDNDGNTPLHLITKFECYFPELLYARHWNADWDVVNNTNFTPGDVFENFTPGDVFEERQTGAQSHEALIGVIVNRTGVRSNLNDWIREKAIMKGPPRRPSDQTFQVREQKLKRLREMANSHMIVAALTTTVALTAGFAMPGGFEGNEGPNQGSPVLLRKTSFKAFMVADTLALLFSFSSLFLYLIFLNYKNVKAENLIISAVWLNVVSIVAMMVAFIAGTSAALSHSSGLTITVCIISSLFFFLVFYYWYRVLKVNTTMFDIVQSAYPFV